MFGVRCYIIILYYYILYILYIIHIIILYYYIIIIYLYSSILLIYYILYSPLLPLQSFSFLTPLLNLVFLSNYLIHSILVDTYIYLFIFPPLLIYSSSLHEQFSPRMCWGAVLCFVLRLRWKVERLWWSVLGLCWWGVWCFERLRLCEYIILLYIILYSSILYYTLLLIWSLPPLLFISSSPHLFFSPSLLPPLTSKSSHSFYTCRYLYILTYILIISSSSLIYSSPPFGKEYTSV